MPATVCMQTRAFGLPCPAIVCSCAPPVVCKITTDVCATVHAHMYASLPSHHPAGSPVSGTAPLTCPQLWLQLQAHPSHWLCRTPMPQAPALDQGAMVGHSLCVLPLKISCSSVSLSNGSPQAHRGTRRATGTQRTPACSDHGPCVTCIAWACMRWQQDASACRWAENTHAPRGTPVAALHGACITNDTKLGDDVIW